MGKKSLQATITGQGEEATKANGDKNDIAVAMRTNVSRSGDPDDIPEFALVSLATRLVF